MGRKLFGISLILFFTGLVAAHTNRVQRRAIVIGLDGLRGDIFQKVVFDQDRAPQFLRLAKGGVFSDCQDVLEASCARIHEGPRYRKGFLWSTGPGWASVVTGVSNRKHLIKDNDPENLEVFTQSSKRFPTIFKRAKDYGLHTAAGGVGAFLTSHLDRGKEIYPGVLDYECGALPDADATSSCNLDVRHALENTDPERDEKLTAWLIEQIRNPEIDLIMGVYDQIDGAGHEHGFGENKYYENAIIHSDSQVGRVIDEIARAARRGEEWLVVLTSDHGGHNTFVFWGDHKDARDVDEVVPFIVTLFGSHRSLNQLAYPVNHMDVHPTILSWFGIPIPDTNIEDALDGHVQGVY